MKKAQKKQKENEDSRIKALLKSHHDLVSEKAHSLMMECIRFSHNLSPNQLIKRWLYENSGPRTNDILMGERDLLSSMSGIRVSNLNALLRCNNLMCGSEWSFKITNKFYQNVCSKVVDESYIIAHMSLILSGHFSIADQSIFTKAMSIEPLGPLQAYFCTSTSQGYTLFWEVGVDKIPKINSYKNYQKELLGYDFIHTITFFDIRFDANIDKVANKIIKIYHNDVQTAIHRQEYQNLLTSQSTKGNPARVNKKHNKNQDELFTIQTNDLGNVYGELNYRERSYEIIVWKPTIFQELYLTKQEQQSFVFDQNIQRWVSKDYEAIQQAKLMREYQTKINKDLIKRYADFSTAAKLVELLQKIPNFKIRLTEEEQKVVGADGNVMVIGRSGTGKTTCSILRLFAMETLFKLRLDLYKQKHENVLQNYNYTETDENKSIGLHCIFATASPVLTTEVKKYYQKLTKQVKDELEKKRQRIKQQKLQQQQQQQQELQNNQFEQSTVQMIDDKIQEEKFFEQQMADIKLNEDQEGFQEQINEEDWEAEEEKLKQEMNAFNSFADMKESDFPAFFTIKKLILLIDGCLTRPFFSRTDDNKIIGSESNAQWSTEASNVIFINSYLKKEQDAQYDEEDNEPLFEENDINVDDLDEFELEEEYQRRLFLLNKPQIQNRQQAKSKLSQEVDFDFFCNNFWFSKYNKYSSIGMTASFIWTQIYSNIKGSASAHTYPGHYVPKRVFCNLNKNEKVFEDIFECFILYERWKVQFGYYDFMDVVNHILVQLTYGRVNLIPIHYLMIDEVQDLPHAMLLLLCKVTEQGLFFSGDTAQNIAKGVGFRFQDLKSIFLRPDAQNHFQNNDLSIHQLTINFRSHNNILQLANSIVSLLEIYFPKTIDKLKKESSNILGPKPIIVNAAENLFYLLSGEQNDENTQVGSRLPIEFGCNQVILVKDQESKKKIPSILQHALVLTIYEAKGLEFDDVILYNFFCDNFIGEMQWRLLQTCEVKDEEVNKEKYLDSLTKHHTVDQESSFFTGYEEKNGNVIIKRLMSQIKYYDEQSYFNCQLCNELKQLYVAITRPRQRLIIFDEQPETRQRIENIWQQLNLVDYFTEQQLQQSNSIQKVAKKTSPEEWKKQGLKMFRNKFYEQAEKCFMQSQDEILEKKARAFRLATEGNQLQQEISQVQSNSMKKKEKKQKLKQLQQDLKNKYKEAAELFINLQNFKQAAQCYYSGELYEQAFTIYKDNDMYNEAGEAAYKCGRFSEAAEYFLKSEDLIRTVDAYEKSENYEEIFKVLHQLKDKISVETRSAFLKKYLPIVLDKLANEVDQKEKNEQPQQKNNQQVIEEGSSDEDDDDEDEDEEQDQVPITEVKKQEQLISNEVQEDKITAEELLQKQKIIKQAEEQQQENIIEMSSQLIKSIPNESSEQIKQLDDSQSFSVQNSESFQVQNSLIQKSVVESESFQVEQEEGQDQDFEHLSHFDPEDQWLKNDNKSIIESLASNKKSESSDFSAFAYAQIQGNPNVQFVKTKGDIFIQDSIMQQIIKYISMFSDEFKYQLFDQRSKLAQLSNKQVDQNECDYMVDFILDLDLVDISFIYLVLDILEQFKSYKLCIFVCNRYRLADQLGRYLVSIAANYSPLALQSASLNVSYLVNGKQRQAQVDKGLVGAFAIHNVFENINPEFITLKFNQTKLTTQNSLGLDCYTNLILLGFWKKTVYQMNAQNSFSVCKLFMDFKNWRFIYYSNQTHIVGAKINENYEKDRDLAQIYQTTLILIQKKLDVCFQATTKATEQLIFNYPKNQEETEFAIITLEQYYSEMIAQLTLNQRVPKSLFYRANTFDFTKIVRYDLSPKQNLPQLYSLTEEIFNCLIAEQNIKPETMNILCDNILLAQKEKKDDLSIYQSVFLLLFYSQFVIHNAGQIKSNQWVSEFDSQTYVKYVKSIKLIVKLINSQEDSKQELRNIVTRSVLFYFKIRQPDNVEILNPFINSLIIHRQSIVIQGLVEKRNNLQLKGVNIVLDDYYFADIDFEFISAPRSSVMFLINNRLNHEISAISHFRSHRFSEYQFDELYPHEYRAHFEDYSSFYYGKMKKLEYVQKQQQSSITNSTVDLWIQKEKELLQSVQLQNFRMKHGFETQKQELEQGESYLFSKSDNKLNKKSIILMKNLLKNPHLKCQSQETKQFATQLALQKIKKQDQFDDAEISHSAFIKFILLMNYADKNHLTFQYFQKKVDQGFESKYEPYLRYLECLICKQHNIISDATELYLTYQDERRNLIRFDEQIINLTSLILNNMIGLLLNNKQKCEIFIPNSYFIYFDKITTKNDDKYLYETSFHTIDNQEGLCNLLEIWFQLYQEKTYLITKNLKYILYTLILNLNEFKPKLLNVVKLFLNDIMVKDEKDQFEQLISGINLKQKDKFEKFTNNMKAISLLFGLDDELYQLEIQNVLDTPEKVDDAYQKCLDSWEDLKTKSINLEKSAKKLIQYYKQYKKGSIFSQSNQFNFGEYQLSRKLKTSKFASILYEFIKIRKLLCSTFYSMLLTNSIDFHFITLQLKNLVSKENEFIRLWRKFRSQKINQVQFLQEFDEQYKESQIFIENLKQWQKNSVTFEQRANKLLERNKKLLALKWMNNKAGLTLQKIQKRKKGLKRQQLLDSKKLFLKF